MKAAKLIIFFIASIIIASIISINISYAAETSSPQYNFSTIIISSGGDIVNGSNYKSYTASGIISGVVESGAYKNFLGFFYTWLLANGEQCSSASQCQGGSCCSGFCASGACPVSQGGISSGGGGGGGDGGGGGESVGGGAFIIPQEKRDFSINPVSVKIKLALGDSDEKKVRIKTQAMLGLPYLCRLKG